MDWPFEIKLVPVKSMLVDHSYQRPKEDEFVAKMANAFDPRAVGTLIGAARVGGKVAIIEGQQRFEVLKKVGVDKAYCCVLKGMTIADEAEMFYRINKDRKSVNPYYNLRARKVAGDEVAVRIFDIVEESDFKLGVSPSPKQINAVAAVEHVFRLPTIKRDECLTPTLRALSRSFKGMAKSTDAHLIRGLGVIFQSYSDDEIDFNTLYDVLAVQGAPYWINQAKEQDKGNKTSKSRGFTIARLIVRFYNNDIKGRGPSLQPRYLTDGKSRKAA